MRDAMQFATTTSVTTPAAASAGRFWAKWALKALPFLIALLALGLRLQGIDWDGGSFYHPDERSIYLRAEQMFDTLTDAPGWEANANRDFPLDTPGIPSFGTFFDKDASPLNPHWFPLGTIIIYILVAVRGLLELFMDQVRLQDLASAGRTIAALVDSGSVLLMYFLGRRLYSRSTGLLASALTALAVINIQLTHFYRPESFVILLTLASFWWMLNVLERGRVRDHLGLGLVVGLSFAFRSTGLPLLFPVAATYGLLAWRRWQFEREMVPEVGLLVVGAQAVTAGFIALLTFAVLQPYGLLDFHKFFGDLGWETGIARTAGTVPYTVQYVGTPINYLYEIRQSAVWALGLPLGIVAWGGLALSTVVAFFRQRTGELLLLAWVVPLILTIGLFEVKFLRYIAPVLPVMVLLGSRWLVDAHVWARERSHALQRAVLAVIVFVLAATGVYAFAFVGIYAKDHPGIQASKWINENAEPGSVLLTDNHWDEGFPDIGRFTVAQLPMYEGDTLTKVERVSNQLAAGDYIMAYSNRPWGSIARLPERYPYSSNYYRALFSGELGYELVQGFTRYPELAGISFVHDPFSRAGLPAPESIPGVQGTALAFDLGYADENVTNYDRPLVLVWENVDRLSLSEVRNVLLGGADDEPIERAMLDADAWDTQRAAGTWTDLFSEGGLNGAAPWLVWLLAIELIFVVTLPLAARVLRWLPDRGVVLARPLGLLLVAWIVWMGASTGVWGFSRGSVFLAIALLAAVSGVLAYRNRGALLALLRHHGRYLLSVELLFLAAYFTFVLVRAANPDLWHPWRGGEKPMDLAYLTAVIKSTTFPPYDPWYAGGFINYYYFGFVIVGALVRVTSIVPAVAYNLAVPLLFAVTLSSAFSVGYNLTEGLRQRMHLRIGARSTILAGLATAMLMVVLANVDGGVQLLQGAARTLTGEAFGNFDFWRSSRLMPGQINITEFPFWTFLFADLHAHLISLPFQVLAVGLLANVVLSARSRISTPARLPAIALAAFVIGALAAINTWDVPAYGLLGVAAIAIAVYSGHRGPVRPTMLGKLVLLVAGFWLLLYLLWLPFHQSYEPPFSGLKLSQWRTVAWHYAGVHVLLMTLVGTWLFVEGHRLFSKPRPPLASGPGADASPAAPGLRSLLDSSRLSWVLGAALLGLVAAFWVRTPALHQWTTVAVLLLFFGTALALALRWIIRRADAEGPVHLLLLTMALLALGVGIGVDFVTAPNDIDRMNTVFKFYLNAWVLFSIVAGAGLWHLWATGALRLRRAGRWGFARGAWLGVLAILVMAAAVYPVLGTRARLADRFDTTLPLTLDGAAYQRVAEYGDPGPTDSESDDVRYALLGDANALEFIQQNIEGSPVFLEAAFRHSYRWYPRTAAYAGLPVVLGYQWHQQQQRGAGGSEPGNVNRRMADVQAMYTTTDADELETLLRKYQVGYVYVGPAERAYFPVTRAANFAAIAESGVDGVRLLESIYANDQVTIYRVLPAEG